MKLIDHISETFELIEFLKEHDHYREAQEEIASAFKGHFDISIDYIHSLPEKTFIDSLLSETNYTPDQMGQLADLLYANAELYYVTDNKALYKDCYRKALSIYEYLIDNGLHDAEMWMPKIKKIEKILYTSA